MPCAHGLNPATVQCCTLPLAVSHAPWPAIALHLLPQQLLLQQLCHKQQHLHTQLPLYHVKLVHSFTQLLVQQLPPQQLLQHQYLQCHHTQTYR
jgi:hypothetical protein